MPTAATVPVVGSMIPAISLSRVLLPDPLRPIRPTDSPGSMSRSTSRSAQNSVPLVRRRRSTVSFTVRLRSCTTR